MYTCNVSYLAHYLDDFIIVEAPNSEQCLRNQTILFETCKELGIPLAPHKSVGPTTCLISLGIEIDSVAMELRLPCDKLHRLKELLSKWQFKKVCSKEQLESLLGHLSHARMQCREARQVIHKPAYIFSLRCKEEAFEHYPHELTGKI